MVEDNVQTTGDPGAALEPADGGFIIGVVEGFYGRPWIMEQRIELFRRQKKWGLKTYLYAPKDDYKHRFFWRDLYSVEEAEQLVALISSAKEHGIEFIYAISPGLDITFSSHKDVSILKRKLDQVSLFGCTSFALLFDDIDRDMCPADKEMFGSFAHAQVSITNEIFRFLGEPQTFLFCPTEYCGTLCYPSVSQSLYLRTIGEELLPGIQVLWTGPKVISKDITVDSIKEVSRILRRPPVLWDNIHANDYDQKCLFLGPYKGRPTQLLPWLGGVLLNPNCEFECNFIAIHTLATWYKSNMEGTHRDVVMADYEDRATSVPISIDEDLNVGVPYSPQPALQLALAAWLPEFGLPCQDHGSHGPQWTMSPRVHVPFSPPYLCPSTSVTTIFHQPIMSPGTPPSQQHRPPAEELEERKELDEEPMEMVEEKQEDMNRVLKAEEPGAMGREGEGSVAAVCMDTWPGPAEQATYVAESPTLEDLQLLVELFYLPYEHGSQAVQMLREFSWLQANSSIVGVNLKCKDPDKVAEWRSRAKMFEEMCRSVIRMFTRLSSCANGIILYDLYPYIWDIKNVVTVVKAFVQWLEAVADRRDERSLLPAAPPCANRQDLHHQALCWQGRACSVQDLQ